MTTYMLHNITAGRRQKRLLLALSFFIFHLSFSIAQTIKIGGNVYGGGKSGDLSGSTKVTVLAGDLNEVYGGAQMADIGGQTFVHIDGEHASDDILIKNVFGGNDVSGTIGKGENVTTVPPAELKNTTTNPNDPNKTKSFIDDSWKTFIRTSACTTKKEVTVTVGEGESAKQVKVEADDKLLLIGTLYGGSNGAYDYTSLTLSNNETANPYYGKTVPNISKTYLEIMGGCIAHIYGGGNNATVTEATTINIDNSSDHLENASIVYAVNHDKKQSEVLADLRRKVNLTTFQSNLTSYAFNHARVFGGNNVAKMTIRPKWNLQKGIIRDLYSGGNEGDMIGEEGLLLEIDPDDTNKDQLVINNVYGGCRRADVRPMRLVNGNYVDVTVSTLSDYRFPPELSARTLVRGGKITNVYGGNDISGHVFGGNAVGIYTSISGDVYGGGNGSYAYTDNEDLGKLDEYKDFYYSIDNVLAKEREHNPSFVAPAGFSSVDALNIFRPNAEQVSIRLAGTDKNNPVIIGGSVYVGGNSATLQKKESGTDYLAELKIGSHVIAENVFLGNNGKNMVASEKTTDVLQIMASTIDGKKFNTMDLTDETAPGTFEKYMEGCALDLIPGVVFDSEARDPAPYEDYSSYFGSFYCGGNVGSMTASGTTTIDFNHKIIIYDKLVGGCNSAFVPKTAYNAAYEGGVIGSTDERSSYEDRNGNIRNRLILNLSNLKIQPMRWAIERDADYTPVLTDDGKPIYLTENGHRYLEWNTVDSREYNTTFKTYKEMAANTDPTDIGETDEFDLARRLFGGNIYGGCCQSGIVNGNVVINLNEDIVEREKLFDEVQSNELGEEESLYGNTQTEQAVFNITKRNTGVILGQQGMDVFGSALNVFGGGKGEDTEIWGSTVINLNKGYTFQIFGGSEDGVIGKPLFENGKKLTTTASNYTYDPETGRYAFDGKLYEYNAKYSCYVNLCGTKEGTSKADEKKEQENNNNTGESNTQVMAECEFMYGGGFFGPICGNTVINMGNGRIFNSFAGSCNGDILGTAETFIGRQVKPEYKIERPSNVVDNDVFVSGFPWVRDIVYGANDLGGRIFGVNSYKTHVRGQREWDPTDFEVYGKIHSHDGDDEGTDPDVLQASAYVEYLQGRADAIFGGCYGTYNYKDSKFERYTDSNGEPLKVNGSPIFYKPFLDNAFVNFRPTYESEKNAVKRVFGAGQGQSGETNRDKLQNRSYVLVDIPDAFEKYTDMEVFGAGAWCGLGMGLDTDKYDADKDKGSAIIDLIRGKICSAYGGSYEEGVIRRTLVNVPRGSTICMYTDEPDYDDAVNKIKHVKERGNIFGGAYGTQILPPCDVYEANVQYHSRDAEVKGAIYGGNNSERRSIYTHVEIDVPVFSNKSNGYLSTVYGAGQGQDTWAEHTEVNLKSGAQVYEVYGGGMMGHVLNAESVQQYMQTYSPKGFNKPSDDIAEKDPKWSDDNRWNTEIVDGKTKKLSLKDEWKAAWAEDWKKAWSLGANYYIPNDNYDNYVGNTVTNLTNTDQVRSAISATELDVNTAKLLGNTGGKYNTNVIIHEGATVAGYAYGGGYGKVANPSSGDVYGTTYITLLGGTVSKDIYAAGTAGSVNDMFGTKQFTASANVYIKGGTLRNAYGGGWRGSVGFHPSSTNPATNGLISDVAANANDIFGDANVVIGDAGGTSHVNGIPSVTRNVYGGGEGGAIYGTAHVYLNNGRIGYRYKDNAQGSYDYVEELDDEEEGDNKLYDSGNIFGGGYVANSYVDNTDVKIYGGIVRGSVYGGGEIGPIGRGTLKADAPAPTGTVTNGPEGAVAKIYKPGTTRVEMYKGHVLRNVFGGGRGHDNWGGEGWMTKEEELTMDRSAKGFIFGQTQVYIHGGEIGTDEGMAENFGNVFGGCDVGYVYSAYAVDKGTNGIGKKSGKRYNIGVASGATDYDDEGYYYKYENNDFIKEGTGEKTFKVPTEDCKVVIGPNCKVEKSGLELTGIFYPKETVIPALDLDYIKANPSEVTGTYDDNGKVEEDLTFDRTYNVGEFVSTYALHTLKDKTSDSDKWDKIDDDGIIIHNAVFAGGNVSAGSTDVFANTTTVYGNATASIHDVYHRDLITIGTGHTGGLYGDGNLTFVDGYRGLNITNYGTDYYNITMEISLDTYKSLPNREQAYYELKYTCIKECTDINGKKYHPASDNLQASSITADELQMRFEGTDILGADGKPNPTYWMENGVCSRYAGRIMNTIQRADFCGVFGSRMVMQGAQDRVPEVVDNAHYTINRVREVSLNKKESVIAEDKTGERAAKHKEHGNYFGIYNNVNFLGALTSDVFFNSPRTTNNGAESGLAANGTTTFYDWKAANYNNRKRNRGTCHNEVALASGVYLELTTDNPNYSNKNVEEKDWGYINGVIMLDLINVQQGIGGGFVYAKNVHGKPSYEDHPHATLTALNANAVTRKDFSYKDPDTYPDDQEYWETSGNFIHDTQTIIDDCYPVSNRYKGDDKVPAHYWYIKGTVYIYDQYISAYTGAPNAYSKTVNIPLTITAASHGQMKLMNIQPNLYAYWADKTRTRKLGPDDVLEFNGKEYRLNDPITYWDYNILNAAGQRLFEPKTYVTIAECEINGTTYPAGYVMMPDEYSTLRTASTKTVEGKEVIKVTSHDKEVDFDYVFRESNNLSHEKGYILTYEVNNPEEWNTWYTPKTGDPQNKINSKEYDILIQSSSSNQDLYNNGPTYKVTTAGLYGQNDYSKGDIIPKTIYTDYEGDDIDGNGTIDTSSGETKGLKQNYHSFIPETGQATFESAYVVTKNIEATNISGKTVHLYPGATVVKSDFTTEVWTSMSGSVETAYVCTSTLEAEDKSLLLINTVLTAGQITTYRAKFPDIDDVVELAYSCTTAGKYGGKYYTTDDNNRGLAAWSSMSAADRENFKFNYDALNLLIDKDYDGTEGEKYQYDGEGFTTEAKARENKAGYSLLQPVDYTATYDGTSTMYYNDKSGTEKTVAAGAELSRTDFEALPNEQRHYTAIKVPSAEGESTVKVYVVHKSFIHGDTPYAAGQTMTNDEYKSMNDSDLGNITTLEFTAADANKTYFFCRESYKVNENGEGMAVTNLIDGTGFDSSGETVTLTADHVYDVDDEVPVGVLIKEGNSQTNEKGYIDLTNRQTNFTIHGVAPVETSTLYVSRESDIYDLSTEKIITVIYEYNYEEADESGLHVSPVSERHVVNIHITFQSGVPEIEDISAPKIVLPGTLVNLRTPNVTPGAYEVTGGGWMLFEKESDTESHNNGIEYTPTDDPLYWYQNKYWVAYYAQTYLGKTFSNAVQVSVANYHDLADVMADHNKAHHMYIDNKNVERDPKIYITTSDGLDLFKNLYDLSLVTGSDGDYTVANGKITAAAATESANSALVNHNLVNSQIRAGSNLEFFLRTDIDHSGSAWKPIGTLPVADDPSTTDVDETVEGICFEGTLHGDGHTISGLDNSLFNYLCGSVYNLGVTGSFTGAGVVETGDGYVENCWINTSATVPAGDKPYAVFGNPTGGTGTQIVNCYYPKSNEGLYLTTTCDRGNARIMPDKAFYNGTVAYDLNGFYLNKRYYDGSGLSEGKQYNYWKANVDGTLSTDISNAYYPADYAIYPLEGEEGKVALRGYVEERFADGDFIYSGGTIPDYDDERLYVDGSGNRSYHPIWPDDYLFFGQALNYGHMDGKSGRDVRTPQEWPSAVNKSDSRILTALTGNRVYRAPAYFRSSKMGVAHFNSYAVFASKEKLTDEQIADNVTAREVYPNMTAIDFTGYNDVGYNYQKGWREWSETSQKAQSEGMSAEAYAFYPPLLDDGGLNSFYNADLTRNLLAYTGTDSEAAMKTDEAVRKALPDLAYTETESAPIRDPYYDTKRYHTVEQYDADKIRGHRVQKQTGDTFMALNDHVLVDKNDFNAPMAYSFAAETNGSGETVGYRMWHQRKPDNYVGKLKDDQGKYLTNAGWEGISLPFKAEIVTTDVKGEITHFYNNSSKDDLGHEYWLREFKGVKEETKEISGVSTTVATADLRYPDALGTDGKKDYTNTFLWDYYYSYNEYMDLNKDEYQEVDDNRYYYKHPRSYQDYPRLNGATAYIIGFPGERYYEFDLSGNFEAETAYQLLPNIKHPAELGSQVITFASKPGDTQIGVSDEATGTEQTYSGHKYTFKPSYLNETFKPGTDTDKYTLNSKGSSYDVVPSTGDDDVTVSAFRPFFVKAASGSARQTRSIIFSQSDDLKKTQPSQRYGIISARPGNHKITVSSSLEETVTIRIISPSGLCMATFDLQPGESRETHIVNSGVYIVQSSDGKYTRKLSVR